jgi:hypothetical protein
MFMEIEINIASQGMRNKQDLWITSFLTMTDNRLTLRPLLSVRLSVIAGNKAIQKVHIVICYFSPLRGVRKASKGRSEGVRKRKLNINKIKDKNMDYGNKIFTV